MSYRHNCIVDQLSESDAGCHTLREIVIELSEEIDRLREELELTQRRCDRNRDTSSDWMD